MKESQKITLGVILFIIISLSIFLIVALGLAPEYTPPPECSDK